MHHYGSVSAGRSDQPPPTPEQLRRWRLRASPPENELPGTVPVDVVLARTDDVAVALGGVYAYSTGLKLDIAVRLRRQPDDPHDADPFMRGGPMARAADRALLLGVEYADGRTATNVGGRPRPDDSDAPSLGPTSGGGGGRRWDMGLWLTPLPESGDLVIVTAWPARGIDETRTTIDAQVIADARARVVVLWPFDPDDDERPRRSPPPDVRPGGWFAHALGEHPDDAPPRG